MKICLLGNGSIQQFPLQGYGGIEVCVESLAQGLHDAGAEFFALVPKRDTDKEYPFRIRETEMSPLRGTNKEPSVFAYSAKKIIEEEKPDIIWSQSHWSANCLHDLGIPIICTFHDSCVKQWGWIKRYPNVRYRFLSRFSYRNWVTEEWEKEKSFILHSGVKPEDYKFSNEHDDYILWVAGLQWGLKAKGLDVAMLFSRKFPDQEFRIYGVGAPKLEEQCKDFSEKVPNFNYLGELKRGEAHHKAFSRAKAFLMPTRIPDTFPRVVLESMSKGTPVMGLNMGSVPEMIGETGGVVFSDLPDSIDDLLKDTSREKVFERSLKYSIDNEIEGLIKESKKLIEKEWK